jgi:endonuclease-3
MATRKSRKHVAVKLEKPETKKSKEETNEEEEINDDEHFVKSQKDVESAFPNWEIMLDNIRKMRFLRDAPVDSLGCEVLADPEASESVQRFQILVALMLSSQV